MSALSSNPDSDVELASLSKSALELVFVRFPFFLIFFQHLTIMLGFPGILAVK